LSQSDFDLGFWSDRGWKVPKEFELAEDDHPFIDYTFQYLVSIPIHSPVRDKSFFLQNELLPSVLDSLKIDLEVEMREGWSYCLTKMNTHLGEIVDSTFYLDPCSGLSGITCVNCGKESPESFDLCWLCGSLLTQNREISAFANVFIEITANTSIDDLVPWQYDEGPSRWKEIEWESVVKDYFEELCEIPDSSFFVVISDDGDTVLNTESFEITVRFNPLAMVQ
jgi:hypothetical protein